MSQTTSIGRSTGSGKALASAPTASRVERERRAQAFDPYGVVRPSPGSADLAVDEKRAWPHAGRPETLPLVLARNEKLTLCSVEQEVGIAARQQARGCGERLGGANRRLVRREQPLVAKWRSNRQQRCLEGRECVSRRPP